MTCSRSTFTPAPWPRAPRLLCLLTGGAGLLNALYDAGIIMNEIDPNYAVAGESKAYFCGKPNPLMIRIELRRDSYYEYVS